MPISKGGAIDDHQPRDLLRDRLLQLIAGKTVDLVSTHEERHGKQVRSVKQLVLIAPGKVYNACDNIVVVSVVGKGSCIFDFNKPGNSAKFITAGLPRNLANELFTALKSIGENEYATREPTVSTNSEILVKRSRRPRKNAGGNSKTGRSKRAAKKPG